MFPTIFVQSQTQRWFVTFWSLASSPSQQNISYFSVSKGIIILSQVTFPMELPCHLKDKWWWDKRAHTSNNQLYAFSSRQWTWWYWNKQDSVYPRVNSVIASFSSDILCLIGHIQSSAFYIMITDDTCAVSKMMDQVSSNKYKHFVNHPLVYVLVISIFSYNNKQRINAILITACI